MAKRFSFLEAVRFFFHRAIRKSLEIFTRKKNSKIYSILNIKEISLGKICLFAHFDPSNKIREYVILHLIELKKLNFEILFITTSNLNNSELEKISTLVNQVVIRENIGYDFGSWVVGFNLIKDNNIKEIILTNDSVYGPFSDIKLIYESMQKKNLDFWGLTDSYEVKYHIQSYFLCIGEKILQDKRFWDWLNKFYYYRSEFKTLIVNKYEIGISRFLLSLNYKIDVFISYYDLIEKLDEKEIASRSLESVFKNPTLNLWEILILKYNFPFLKRNLLTSQRISSYKRILWKKKLSKFKKLISIIENDLKDI